MPDVMQSVPSYCRGCYGCYGPKETPNTSSLSEKFSNSGLNNDSIMRMFRTFNACAEPFRKESEAREIEEAGGKKSETRI